jgi:hypothetical protein
MAKKASENALGATNAGARPGDYCLGSPQSRAAARAILARRNAGRKRQDIIFVSTVPLPDGQEIRIGEWSESRDGILTRTSFLPPDMTIEEAERIVSERTVRPADAYDNRERVRRRLIVEA